MSRLLSSLRFQLIAIVLLSVLPAMALNLYSGFEERTSAALQAQKNAKRLVELASAQQARVIGEARSLLFTLSQSPHGYLMDAPQCSTYFRELLTSHPFQVCNTSRKIQLSRFWQDVAKSPNGVQAGIYGILVRTVVRYLEHIDNIRFPSY